MVQVKTIIIIVLLLVSFSTLSKPRITTMHDQTREGFARIKVTNETTKELICFVAIDGRKVKFRLLPHNTSKWYKANDTRFNYIDFKTWCDFAELYNN